ncbi:ATP-dependent 6-phosphofructokinase 5, chloroplastic-like [Impatiens glandulifera]|uniref:ATP-dependent 6-phosphofructokinase 5, chloroplastic-like n=1 Tax=Impatiens glandulifera TaxID=253017 RepID=UPI001FB0B162|nr:ATP-dependent 6-phosphofructokinase 5, chloroplastic-like [Impatiens glandulifera]
MESLSPAIMHKLILPVNSSSRFLLPSVNSTNCRIRNKSDRITNLASSTTVRSHAEVKSPPPLYTPATVDEDGGTEDWKSNYQRDFESRFNIPHLTEVFDDLTPYPSTFCLRTRSPTTITDDHDLTTHNCCYPSDQKWNGYINNNDRVLLKVIKYSSPTSAGAECIDPDCGWVEQW